MTIPAPGIARTSAKDYQNSDYIQVDDVDLTATSPGVLGTMTVTEANEFGSEPPQTFNIVGVSGDAILLQSQDPLPSYLYLSNVDISTTDHDAPTFPITLTTTSVDSYVAPTSTLPCFGAGTRIATPSGDVAVEALAVGDVVMTFSGEPRRIVWVGSRTVNVARHREPSLVRPVRIEAGAFDVDLPARDLVLSPDHNLFVDNVLIPAKCLVNGTTVSPLEIERITYHHIELDEHDVVLAEGLPAETYLDTGNRNAFANAGVTVAHPDFASSPDVNYFAWGAKGCASLVIAGPTVDNVRARLAQRAALLRKTRRTAVA